MKQIASVLCFALGVVSCATVDQADEDEATPKGPKLVGIVASIPRSRSFVLIQSYGAWTVPPGSVITTRGEDERTANLRFTGEKLGQFAAADIQAGDVEKGDAVYSFHKPKAKPVGQNAALSPATTRAFSF